MPTLNIEGVGRIKVDDSFRSLSADEQEAFVAHVAEQVKGGKKGGEFDATPNASIGNNLVGGALQTVADLTKTGEKLGLVSKETSKAADASAKAAFGGRSGTERFFGNDTSFNSGVNAAAEGAASMGLNVGAGLAGGALGGALAGSVAIPIPIVGTLTGAGLGALGGYFASDLAQNYGRRLEAREQANNGQEAGALDKTLAVATSVPQAAINALQVGKALKGATTVAEKSGGQVLKRVAESAGAGAAGNVLGDTAEQIGRNVLTENGETDIGQTAKSALLGAGVGGAVRGTGEAVGIAKRGLDSRALKDYEFKEDVAPLMDRLEQTAADNKLDLNRTKGAAETLRLAQEEHAVERAEANKYGRQAVELAKRAGLDQDTITRASTALESDAPKRSHVDALQKVTEAASQMNPDRAVGFQAAVDAAKRASTLQKAAQKAHLKVDENNKATITGGMTGAFNRVAGGLAPWIKKATGLGAGLYGIGHYAGYAGLPLLGQAGAVLGNAGPLALAAAATYGAANLTDRALNIHNPIKRLRDAVRMTEGGDAKPPVPMGGEQGMASMERQLAQKAITERMAMEQAKADRAEMKRWMPKEGKKVKPDEAYPGQRFVADDPNPPPPPPPNPPTQKELAARAKAQKAAFEEIMGPRRSIQRANEERLAREDRETKIMMDQAAKNDAAAAKKAKAEEREAAKAAKAKQEALKKAPIAPKPKDEPKAKNTDESKKAEPVETKKTDAKEPTQADIDKRRAELIQQRRENFLSFETLIKGKFGEEGASVVAHLQDHLNGSTNHGKPGLKAINELPEKFGEAGAYAQKWWLGKGKVENSRFGRMFFSRKLGKIIMTPKDAEQSRGF